MQNELKKSEEKKPDTEPGTEKLQTNSKATGNATDYDANALKVLSKELKEDKRQLNITDKSRRRRKPR